MVMSVGFTGTRSGSANDKQATALRNTLWAAASRYGSKFHHGKCIGGDHEAHVIMRRRSPRGVIVIHPPVDGSLCCDVQGDETRQPLGHLARNEKIVDESLCLVALSGSPKEILRSGTWATVRYARKLARHIYIVWPSGRVTEENAP